jgi:hypothetical protein
VVAVTTASSLVYVDLKETGPDTQIFRNSESETGELLYLSTDDVDDDPIFGPTSEDKIKVMSEEVLTFWLRIPPAGGGYKRSVDKMVDRAEIGVEWQDHYDYYNYAAFLEGYGFSKELYENINTYSGTTWFKNENFKNDNLDSQKSHWYYNSDSGYADSVDIAAWAGHGTYPHVENHVMWFFIDTKPGKEYCVPLYWSEIDWGDLDADWVFIQTCSFLNGTDEELKQLVSSVPGVRGAHLICSFTNEARMCTGLGTYLAEKLSEMSIKQAWFDYCQEKMDSGTTAKVFGAEECMDDSLAGSGPIETSRNPTIDSNWTSVTETAE